MPLYLSNRPIQKDGGQARDGPSSVHMTRNQRPPGPSAPRGDTASGNCLEIATKKMAGPRDGGTVLSYGTIILSFAYDYKIMDNPCTFLV